MEKQVLESSEERTFQYQDSLPSLPVPPLDESLSKYLDAVKPFLNQEEYQRTEHIVKKFGNGIGKELHQKLLERAKTRRNWLEDWWLNVAYLDLRISTQIHCNMAGPGPYIEHYWPPKEGTQIERASVNREGGYREIWGCCSGHAPIPNALLHVQNSWSYQRLTRQLF
ncbi:peroxisomal carnitine O-octanoyltransferase isoform X3 [Caloenas nicobarica]|uniref:peroxisomal carnitine O-octanoyltransferase isoform X3 n=1 Tax=Caloenas nicobarica TaxID=187106 RepID=UPI0032B754DD